MKKPLLLKTLLVHHRQFTCESSDTIFDSTGVLALKDLQPKVKYLTHEKRRLPLLKKSVSIQGHTNRPITALGHIHIKLLFWFYSRIWC